VITHHLITRRADDDGVDASVVERDYVLAHVVAQLPQVQMPDGGRLVFKGGTALRFVYIGQYRYSADLDFTILNGSVHDAATALSQAVAAARTRAEFPTLEIQTGKFGLPRLAYVGPLAAKIRTVKLDLAVDEHVETVAQGRMLVGIWNDLPAPAAFDVYPLDEITSEKLRCVIQRVQCRDLYDLYRLTEDLKVDLREVTELFHSKARAKSIDPALFPTRFEERTEKYEERWEREMGEHLMDPPRFDNVLRVVRRNLRQAALI
jgi:predicted nucleotidyltransferase component of viral defense system